MHDLILDYSVAQHTAVDLQLKHRCVVEAFRAARPADVHGRRKYDSAQRHNPMSAYVCTEIEYHVSRGWQKEIEHDELAIKTWVADVPQDDIVFAAGRYLGAPILSKLAIAAESAKDWWLAARYWAVVQSVIFVELGTSVAGVDPTVNAIKALGELGAISESEREDFQLAQVGALAANFDITGDLARRPDLVQHVLATQAAVRDPLSVGTIRFIANVMPAMFAGDEVGVGQAAYDTTLRMLQAAHSDPDPVIRAKCLSVAYNFSQFFETMLTIPDFDWDAAYGKDGAFIQAAFDAYQFETTHTFLTKALVNDWLIAWGTPCIPQLHWGDIKRLNANFDHAVLIMSRFIQEPNYQAECPPILTGTAVYAQLVWSCRMSAERQETVSALLHSADLSFAAAEATVDQACKFLMWMRPRGNTEQAAEVGSYLHSAEIFALNLKCMNVLMKRGTETDEEVMLSLPSVKEIIAFSITAPETGCILHRAHTSWNVFVS